MNRWSKKVQKRRPWIFIDIYIKKKTKKHSSDIKQVRKHSLFSLFFIASSYSDVWGLKEVLEIYF